MTGTYPLRPSPCLLVYKIWWSQNLLRFICKVSSALACLTPDSSRELWITISPKSRIFTRCFCCDYISFLRASTITLWSLIQFLSGCYWFPCLLLLLRLLKNSRCSFTLTSKLLPPFCGNSSFALSVLPSSVPGNTILSIKTKKLVRIFKSPCKTSTKNSQHTHTIIATVCKSLTTWFIPMSSSSPSPLVVLKQAT